MRTILAIDPGRDKCGLAVVSSKDVLHKEVVPREQIVQAVGALVEKHSLDRIVIGNGTGAADLADDLRASAISVSLELIDERFSSRRARARFFEANPPKGIRRLIPRGLLTPDRPYDDYVALILAEDYLNESS